MLQLPDLSLKFIEGNDQEKIWFSETTDLRLSLHFFDKKPDLPTLKDMDALRAMYRKMMLKPNGGLVYLDREMIGGFPAMVAILKVPRKPLGMNYMCSCIIPFENFSYVIHMFAREVGVTGMRDNVLYAKLSQQGLVGKTDDLDDWFEDPYDPNYKGGILMNKSEEEQYDDEFPEHPLSVIRKMLPKIKEGIKFDKAIGKHPGFNK